MQECLTFTGADRDTELRRDLRLIKDFFCFQTNSHAKIILFSDQFYTNREEKRWDMILI